MEIIVCVKQVPDTTEVKIDPKTNSLIRQGVPSIVNPFDKHAVEAALQLRDSQGGKVTVLSMGPPQAKEALKECLAMGADEAVLVSDRSFGGADTLATSYTLSAAVRAIGSFDVIICGRQSIDGDTAQVGPELAEHLGIPQITCAAAIDVEQDKIRVKREKEDSYEVVEGSMPILVTVVKSINDPRRPSIKSLMKANRKTIAVWTADDFAIDSKRIGLAGSPTQVKRIFTPKSRTRGEIIQAENAAEAAASLVKKLFDAKIVR